VLALSLTSRIVDEPVSSNRCPEPDGRHLDPSVANGRRITRPEARQGAGGFRAAPRHWR
jgi:hypothetical protein